MQLADIEAGLLDLLDVIRREQIASLAVPPLGCGNGGLAWDAVRPLLEAAFASLPGVRIVIYTPTL